MTKPRIAPNCAANLYAAADERIIAFTTPAGGGLISIRCDEACGIVTVDVYCCDPTVTVLGPNVKRETQCAMCDGTIAVLDRDDEHGEIWSHVDSIDTGCDDPTPPETWVAS